MSLSGLGSSELLSYNAKYRVIICRECKYAIQKSALESHLLRHKIYRNERAQLLASIAKLVLCEPQDVLLPHPTSPPIDGLPVTNGYRCTVGGCGNLCASDKRMRRHWSENHSGMKQVALEECVREAKIQTFFRGTRLRYFEVNAPSTIDTAQVESLVISTGEEDRDDNETYDEQGYDGPGYSPNTAVPPRIPAASTVPPKLPLGDLDLETLTYFHNFTTATSFTLPLSKHVHPTTYYWPTEVVSLALRRRWLMYGLLALSAYHMANLADDTATELLHYERAATFRDEFSARWHEIIKCDGGIADEDATSAGQQIKCLLQLAHWAAYDVLPLQHSNFPQPESPLHLQLFISTVLTFNASEPALRPAIRNNCNNPENQQTMAQSSQILITPSPTDPRSSDALLADQEKFSALVQRLHALPSLMTEAFGSPKVDDIEDVLHTISAIGSLIECCQSSFVSDDKEVSNNATDEARPSSLGAAWNAMTAWLTNLSTYFNNMILRDNPSAIAMLAHWTLLVDRAERCGCWYLRGAADRITREVKERLSGHSDVVRSLAEGLPS